MSTLKHPSGSSAHQFDVGPFLLRHGNALLAQARRYSANPIDAEDAYQQSIEILLTKAPRVDDEKQLVSWALTVVRNEALQMHRRKAFEFAAPFDEISEHWLGCEPGVDETLSNAAELKLGREALARLHPDQTRCLLLRSDGLGYSEISEITGFSYAKVNRLLSQGRNALRARVSMIEAGSECRRLASFLSMVADGEAEPAVVMDVELHLEHCLACQSTLRDYQGKPSDVAAFFPVGLLASVGVRGWLRRIGDALESAYTSMQERMFGHAQSLHQGGDIAIAKKITGIAALSGALVAGGIGVTHSIDGGPPPRGSAAVRKQQPAAAHSVSSRPVKRSAGERKSRSAKASDLAGAGAGRQSRSTEPVEEVGQSAPSTEDFAPPATERDRSAASSDQTTDLAP